MLKKLTFYLPYRRCQRNIVIKIAKKKFWVSRTAFMIQDSRQIYNVSLETCRKRTHRFAAAYDTLSRTSYLSYYNQEGQNPFCSIIKRAHLSAFYFVQLTWEHFYHNLENFSKGAWPPVSGEAARSPVSGEAGEASVSIFTLLNNSHAKFATVTFQHNAATDYVNCGHVSSG